MAMTFLKVPLGKDRTPDGLMDEIGRLIEVLADAMARESIDPGIRWTIDDIDLDTATAVLRGVAASPESLERVACLAREQVMRATPAPDRFPSLGAVRGWLEHGEHGAPVVVTDDGARVAIPGDAVIDVGLVGRRVVARGLVVRSRGSGVPLALAEVSSVAAAEPEHPGGLLAAIGAAPWLMEGEPIDVALRRLRDDV